MISATRRSLLKTSHSGTGPASADTPEGAASIPPPVATDAARERASSSSSSTRTAALINKKMINTSCSGSSESNVRSGFAWSVSVKTAVSSLVKHSPWGQRRGRLGCYSRERQCPAGCLPRCLPPRRRDGACLQQCLCAPTLRPAVPSRSTGGLLGSHAPAPRVSSHAGPPSLAVQSASPVRVRARVSLRL